MDALRDSAQRLRVQVNTLDPKGDPAVEMHGTVEALRRIAQHTEQSLSAFAAIDATIDTLKAALQAIAQSRSPKLCESRCIMSLRTLGSNKKDFKFWHERFVNALAQNFGTKW